MLFRSFRHLAMTGALCATALWFSSCSDDASPVQQPKVDVSELFVGADDADVDYEKRTIVLPEKTESLKFDNLAVLGGEKCYLALDDDAVDPEIDWDHPVKTGKTIEVGDGGISIVVLDDESRVVAVWRIEQPADDPEPSSSEPSSSSKEKSSSSAKEKSSSSSKEKSSSSSEKAESSSSEEKDESSSSEAPESSSEEPESSSSKDVVEASSSSETVVSSSAEEVQLPGSDFNDFWATTSDAMATKETSAAIKISSAANLEFDGGMATIATREVEGSFVLIDGSWKMAGGFYFSGEYAGETALDIYHQGYTSGTPSTDCSDISKDMTFGKPFTARPTAFTVKYSYNHVANKSTDYPQKSLVYVMLVGKGGKVVATGAFSDNESVEMTTRTVMLSYGKDPFGLLSGGYPVAEGLTLGKGDEDVSSIHVMFASSAYAHIVCGGTLLEGAAKKFRGGENSSLVLDDFKLEYLEE